MSYKNILMITSEFPPGPGGIGSHAYNLAKNLEKNGKKVTVLVTSMNSIYNAMEPTKFFFKIERVQKRGLSKYFKLIYLSLKYFFDNKKSDVIITGHLPLIIYGNLLYFFYNKSYAIIHGHEVLMGNYFIRNLTKQALRNISTVIPVSNFSGKKLLESFKHQNIKIIQNGFEHERFEGLVNKKNIKENKLNLVTVGTVSMRKGQHNVLKAIPLLKRKFQKVKYHIIGTNENKSYLQSLIKQLNIIDNVKLHGFLNDKKLSKIMNQSSIFVMLSETQKNGDVEGFGIAILEANHFGLPVIGAKDCGIEDAIDDLTSGILIDKDDVNQFSDAIDEILNNYQEYHESAIKWSKRFHWDKIIKKYLELFN